MWLLKIKVNISKFLMGTYCIKNNVTLVGYPITYHSKKNYILLLTAGQVFGEEKNVERFFRNFKKDKDVLEFEREGNFAISLQKQPKKIEVLYNPDIFWTEPQVLNSDGFAIWNLASFNKTALDKVIKLAEKEFNGEILTFKKSKITSLGLINIVPSLSSKQKQALEIAEKNGYYKVPRKAKLTELAKIMGISLATYQVHLRKAEEKLIPFMLKNYKENFKKQ